MLKLKLQYFGHLMGRVDSLEKTLMLGGIGGRRRRGEQQMRWPDGVTDSMGVSLMNSGSGDEQGGLACCDSCNTHFIRYKFSIFIERIKKKQGFTLFRCLFVRR